MGNAWGGLFGKQRGRGVRVLWPGSLWVTRLALLPEQPQLLASSTGLGLDVHAGRLDFGETLNALPHKKKWGFLADKDSLAPRPCRTRPACGNCFQMETISPARIKKSCLINAAV